MTSSHLPSLFLPSLAESFEKFAVRNFWPLVIILFFFTVGLNGVGLVPLEGYQKYAQHPFVTRVDLGPTNEWQHSILLPVTAFWIGATTRLSFNGLCIGILLLAYGVYVTLSIRRHGHTAAVLLFTLLLGHPISAIVWSWVGMPDCISFLCVVLALFVRSRTAFFVLGALTMMNHPGGALAIGSIVALRHAAREEGVSLHYCWIVLAGAMVGAMAVHAFNAYHDITIQSRLGYMSAMSLGEWVQFNLSTLPSALFSFQQTLWFVLVYLFLMFAPKDPRYFRVLCGIMVASYGITFFTLDTTRVFAMLTWGATLHAVAHCLELNKREYNEWDAKTVLGVVEAFAIAGVLVPRFYIWNGAIYRTPLAAMLEILSGTG